jgi:hypothetical protein
MSEIVNGVKKPSRAVATRIEQATNGAIKASSWDTAPQYGFSENGGVI